MICTSYAALDSFVFFWVWTLHRISAFGGSLHGYLVFIWDSLSGVAGHVP